MSKNELYYQIHESSKTGKKLMKTNFSLEAKSLKCKQRIQIQM